MRGGRFFFLLLAVSAAFSSAADTNPKNLVVNGSFEQASLKPASYQDVPAGSTAIAGWTVTLNHIDYISPGLWAAADGKYSLDLEGSRCNVRASKDCLGGVKQTISTLAGQRYDVTFSFSGNPGAGPKIKKMKVSAAGQSQEFSFDVSGHSFGRMGWKTEHWNFTAKEVTTTLEFESVDNAPNLSGWGPALDNVIVTPSAEK